MANENVSLTNIGGGAAIELFDVELERVLSNIMDPNTDHKKARKIILEVIIKPNEERDMGAVEVQAKSTLAPNKPFPVRMFFDRDNITGQIVAVEDNPKQMKLFPQDGQKSQESNSDKIIDMSKRKVVNGND